MARVNVTEDKIRKWFDEMSELMEENKHILKELRRVFNVDETAYHLNPAGVVVIAVTGRHIFGTSSNSEKENITTLVTVNTVEEFEPPLTTPDVPTSLRTTE